MAISWSAGIINKYLVYHYALVPPNNFDYPQLDIIGICALTAVILGILFIYNIPLVLITTKL